MSKKWLLKAIAGATVIVQLFGTSAFAAKVTGTTDNGYYYWQENFNDYTEGKPEVIKSEVSGITLSSKTIKDGSDNALEIKGDFASDTKTLKINGDSQFDFSRGPVVLSMDVTLPSPKTTSFRLYLNDHIYMNTFYIVKGVLQGYKCREDSKAPWAVNSTVTMTENKKYRLTTVMNWADEEQTKFLLKTYCNGQPLVDADGEEIETVRTYSIDALKNNLSTKNWNLDLVTSAGADVIIDNITMRYGTAQVSIPRAAWANTSSAVAFTDNSGISVAYDKLLYNGLTEQDYTVTGYDLTQNPLMLADGTNITGTKSWTDTGTLALKNLNGYENYVLEITNPSKLVTFDGSEVSGKYSLIFTNKGKNPYSIRKATIYNAKGEKISLSADGKLPQEAARIEFETDSTYSQGIEDAGSITFENIKADRNGDVFTLELGELKPAESYTITVPASENAAKIKQTLTTTGSKPYASAMIEKFDTEDSIDKFTNADKTNISLTWENGRAKYVNQLAATATPKNVTYSLGQKFDFSKGAMLVSFDVTLNQEIKYLSSGSYYFSPQVVAETTGANVGYMPAIETYGVRARNESGGRVATTNAKGTMAVGDTCTISTLFTYYPDKDQIGYIQFADGKSLYNNSTKEIVPEYYIDNASNITEQNLALRFGGRNLADGGLYIDNIMMTTIDGITAENILPMSGSTATINVGNKVAFEEGTDSELTKAYYTNELTKADIAVTKYLAEDKLLAKGENISDFTFDSQSLTVGNLDNDSVYIIRIKDTSKLKSINGDIIDTEYFRTGANAAGLINTKIFDADGNEIYADENGVWPVNAAKIELTFAKGYVTDGVTINDAALTENSDETYVYTQTLLPNTEYTVSVNNSVYGKFTTSDGMIAVSKPVIADDKTVSVMVQNTTSLDKDIYIISALFTEDEELITLVYEKFVAKSNSSETYTLTEIPQGSGVQKAFVWNDFEHMMPYTDITIK